MQTELGLELCLRSFMFIKFPADGAGPRDHTLCSQEECSSFPSLAAGPLREGASKLISCPVISPCTTPKQRMFLPLFFPQTQILSLSLSLSPPDALAAPASLLLPLPSWSFTAKVILGKKNLTPCFPGPYCLAVTIPEELEVKMSTLLESGDVTFKFPLLHGSHSSLELEAGVAATPTPSLPPKRCLPQSDFPI